MKVITNGGNSNYFRIEKTWYNPNNKNWREEKMNYDLVNNTLSIRSLRKGSVNWTSPQRDGLWSPIGWMKK